MIKTGTITQKQSALINGLTQNVGDFNKEMSKTPWGQLQMQQNISTEKYFKLGKHMVILKIEFQKLFNAIFPLLEFIMRIGGAVLGILSRISIKIVDAISWITTFSEKNVDGFNDMRKALLVLAPLILATFAPALAIFLLIALAIEDIWVYMNDGESVIGDVINWFKEAKSSISNFFKNDTITAFFKGIGEANKMLFEAVFAPFFWIEKLLDTALNDINKILDSIVEKYRWVVSKLPFVNKDININNTPAIDPILPTVDLSNGSNTPSSILNNNGKNIKLELRIENGAIQQNFDGNTVPTMEDIMWGVEQKMEDLHKTGWLQMMTEWGVVQ